MAQHRQDHVKSRLAELERLRLDRMHQQQQQQQQQLQQQRSAVDSGFSVPSTSLSLSDL
jgi:hypothetical protein